MNRVCMVVAWLVVAARWNVDRARTWAEDHLGTWRPAR
jgi:hypothetical protein